MKQEPSFHDLILYVKNRLAVADVLSASRFTMPLLSMLPAAHIKQIHVDHAPARHIFRMKRRGTKTMSSAATSPSSPKVELTVRTAKLVFLWFILFLFSFFLSGVVQKRSQSGDSAICRRKLKVARVGCGSLATQTNFVMPAWWSRFTLASRPRH